MNTTKKILMTSIASLGLMTITQMSNDVSAHETEENYTSESINVENSNLLSQDISDNELSALGIEDVSDSEFLFQELESFIQKNPNSSQDEQNEYLKQFIKDGGLVRPKFRSLGNLYDRLTMSEKVLTANYPLQAAIGFNAAKDAQKTTVSIYGYELVGDNSDAFRHCLWNALMTSQMGSGYASLFATAHESESNGIDKEMDLHNNAVGRSGISLFQSRDSIISSVKSKVRYGSCRLIDKSTHRLIPTTGYGMLQ